MKNVVVFLISLGVSICSCTKDLADVATTMATTVAADAADFEFSGQVTASVYLNGENYAGEDYCLYSLVNGMVRGVSRGLWFEPRKEWIHNHLTYSNVAEGDTVRFRLYNATEDKWYQFNEFVVFKADMVNSNALNPFLLKSSYLLVMVNKPVTFNQSCTTPTSLIKTTTVTPPIEIKKNFNTGWTWFSVNILHEDMSIKNVLSSSLVLKTGDYIKNQKSSSTYYEDFGWFGDIVDINPNEMYKIKLLQGGEFKFTGDLIEPSNYEIAIKDGWNWIGYIPRVPLTIAIALNGFKSNDGDYIKNQKSSSTYFDGYGWFGDLPTLDPLGGYMLKAKTTGKLIYPSPKSGYFTDSRDGKIYEWRTLMNSKITYMTQNMAYLASVSDPIVGSNVDPLYYVYGYSGTDVSVSKEKPNYATYGVLYNWPAALTACPSGWHLPTDTEFNAFTDFLISSGVHSYTMGGSDIAKSMASNSLWQTSSLEGAVGNHQELNNSTGFSALPSGYRDPNGSFYAVGTNTWFWTESEENTSAWSRGMLWLGNNVAANSMSKKFGLSVRCFRD